MKKIITVLFILFSGFVFSEEIKPVDKVINFRNTKWAMSKAEVIKSEKIKLIPDVENKNALVGILKIDDIDMMLTYDFIENKLFLSGYETTKKYIDAKEYFKIYNKLKETLIEKYGNPTLIQEDVDNYYKECKQKDYCFLLKEILIVSAWDFKDVRILLILKGGNALANVVIGYTYKELYELSEKRKKEKMKEEL